ncbi:MAG TPA: DUF6183 family protein [Acidimicrobiia bacterium]|nr:DUF6183 family protein [Acidimicrobiia bacterium]
MTDERIRRAIEGSDTDELVRIVDGLVQGRDWQTMRTVRLLCEEAVERGKQLWAIPEYIRYRLALDGPPESAGPAVTEGPTRFTLGPLPEVVAGRLTWDDLDAHLEDGPERAFVAHERVVRGEDLEGASVDSMIMELPLRLLDWESRYTFPIYHSDRVEEPTPPFPEWSFEELPEPGPPVDDPDGIRALQAVTEHWVDSSNGRSVATCVEGDASRAVAALGLRRAALRRVDPATALAWIAWAAASGGAHGRRRGGAAGRFSAWWLATELGGEEWPPDPDRLGDAVHDLGWYLWHDGSPEIGWWLRVAIESPSEGIAWAVSAQDAE